MTLSSRDDILSVEQVAGANPSENGPVMRGEVLSQSGDYVICEYCGYPRYLHDKPEAFCPFRTRFRPVAAAVPEAGMSLSADQVAGLRLLMYSGGKIREATADEIQRAISALCDSHEALRKALDGLRADHDECDRQRAAAEDDLSRIAAICEQARYDRGPFHDARSPISSSPADSSAIESGMCERCQIRRYRRGSSLCALCASIPASRENQK